MKQNQRLALKAVTQGAKTAKEVAEAMKICRITARGLLGNLVSRGDLFETAGNYSLERELVL